MRSGRNRLHLYHEANSCWAPKILEAGALPKPGRAGYVGKNILGSRASASMSGCTAGQAPISAEKKPRLLESLEGKRGLPRVKPPFPATHGLYNKPTVVNNVETLANLPHILNRGAEWFASIGSPPKSTGTRIFCVSGHVKRPGNYEVPMGITFRELIYEHAGGMRSARSH